MRRRGSALGWISGTAARFGFALGIFLTGTPGALGDIGPHRKAVALLEATIDSAAGPESEEEADPAQGMVVRYGSVVASFRFFGDAGASYQSPAGAASSRTSFSAGSFDFFGSVHLSEHLQTLAEVVAEFDADTNAIGIELERLWGSYAWNDRLYLKLGREHSPVSRWNRRYHHGRLFWPAATQPFLARFEDQGGPLPIHHTGAEVGGRVQTRAGEIGYVAVLSNGRGLDRSDLTNVRDRNESKAWDAGGSFTPAGAPGLEFGANYHADRVPVDPSALPAAPEPREIIASVFGELHRKRLEIMAEFARIEHDGRTPGATYQHRLGYVQANFRKGLLTPYLRFDRRRMDGDDPFLSDQDLDLDRWETLLGLRFELGEHGALKVEGGYGRGEARDDVGAVEQHSFTAAALQLAWVF